MRMKGQRIGNKNGGVDLDLNNSGWIDVFDFDGSAISTRGGIHCQGLALDGDVHWCQNIKVKGNQQVDGSLNVNSNIAAGNNVSGKYVGATNRVTCGSSTEQMIMDKNWVGIEYGPRFMFKGTEYVKLVPWGYVYNDNTYTGLYKSN